MIDRGLVPPVSWFGMWNGWWKSLKGQYTQKSRLCLVSDSGLNVDELIQIIDQLMI